MVVKMKLKGRLVKISDTSHFLTVVQRHLSSNELVMNGMTNPLICQTTTNIYIKRVSCNTL